MLTKSQIYTISWFCNLTNPILAYQGMSQANVDKPFCALVETIYLITKKLEGELNISLAEFLFPPAPLIENDPVEVPPELWELESDQDSQTLIDLRNVYE